MSSNGSPNDGYEQTQSGQCAAVDTLHGLSLSRDEADSIQKIGRWLDQGLAAVQVGRAEATSADASLLDLDIVEQGRLLRDGSLTSVALTEACLERIAARDGTYRAFYRVLAESALMDAACADAKLASGLDLGPLHGIPVGVKDLIDVEGVPTTANAPGRRDAVAENHAAVVSRLVAGGAVIVGKLATYEWGTVGPDQNGLFPPAHNPWSPDHITGGSSSGNAAAVAGGLVRTTIGTDTGGSLRGPAFYCGVVGLKPTFGSVATDGVLPLAPDMDHVGPISSTVLEAALTFQVISGRSNVTSGLDQPVSGLRIGYARAWFADDEQTMPAVLEAVDNAASTLSNLGALIQEVELPEYKDIEVAAATILYRESFDLHGEALRLRPEDYGRRAFLSLATGALVNDRHLEQARQIGRTFRSEIDRLLVNHDALLTVGALTVALPTEFFEKEAVWTPMRTIGFNVSGHPVLALPVGFHQDLPIGIQIIGRHCDEATVLRIGRALEQNTDFSALPPQPI